MSDPEDARLMRRAMTLAQAQHGRTGTRPAVGCMIVSKDGRRLSEAATSDGGSRHAEEIALGELDGRAAGATVYVTLEPCRLRSAGGPSCSERLIAAGVSRVVCATLDRHPKGSGGVDALRAAGITVEVGLMKDEAEVLYADFFKSAGDD